MVIIAWWLGALEQLERDARGDEATLRFMDGPYWITLTPQEDDLAQLRCFEDRRGAGVLHEEWVNLPEFVAQVRGIARHVLSACDQAGIASSDVDALKRQLGR